MNGGGFKVWMLQVVGGDSGRRLRGGDVKNYQVSALYAKPDGTGIGNGQQASIASLNP